MPVPTLAGMTLSFEKAVDAGAGVRERGGPALERLAAFVGQLVRALGGAGKALVPLARDEPLLLERTQDAVEVANVDAFLSDHGRKPFEQVVAVSGAFAQEEQNRRDLKALDPTAPAPPMSSMPASIHMYKTYSKWQ